MSNSEHLINEEKLLPQDDILGGLSVEKTRNPVVSVIMGVYNGEKFLYEAIESIINQTYGNFEFIICNDCSKDGSMKILREYEEKDKRIVLLQNERNLGLAATLNKCLSVAKGDFVARMDCDDRALPNRFERQLEWMKEHPNVCAVGSAVEYIDDKGQIYGKLTMDPERFYSLKETVRGSVLVHPSVMMRRDSVLSVGGYSVNALTTRAEDYDLWCKLCEMGGIVANIGDVLFQYREDESNIVRRKYRYRIQECRLKWHWIRRAKRPIGELRYAVRPLIIGLIPLGIYKKLHRRRISGN